MTMSEAAIDGIRDNGFRWSYRINLKPWTARIGRLNDGGGGTQEEREPLVESIVAKVRQFAKDNALKNERMASELISRADDLECCADCDLEDINIAMGELYDSLDYWRVLAG